MYVYIFFSFFLDQFSLSAFVVFVDSDAGLPNTAHAVGRRDAVRQREMVHARQVRAQELCESTRERRMERMVVVQRLLENVRRRRSVLRTTMR